jgi:protein O-mannosyl-transferase
MVSLTADVSRRLHRLIGAGVLLALAAGLYLPFADNPLVFDDKIFFSGENFSYYATRPFALDLRMPAYFTLAFIQTVWGGVEAHRVVGLLFHAACALALYLLIYQLLERAPAVRGGVPADGSRDAAIWAFVGAAAFAVHPVAVYGAAYLVQRTILLATLFCLLSIVLFVRGLKMRSHADAVSAALMYALAVLSKEHAVLLPAAALATLALVGVERRFALRHAAIYAVACAPAALFVVLLSKGVIGHAYEAGFEALAAQARETAAEGNRIAELPWSVSAVTQAGLFFRYLALWIWPSTDAMSIDVRIDFLAQWSPFWIALKITAFIAFGAAASFLLSRGGRRAVIGFGLLYAWILFVVEFSTARFQEPFVLYRSYLWGPGFVLAAVAALGALPRRVALAACVIGFPVLVYQAHDRLESFSSSLRLWEDAAAKLPATPVPWGSRTLYQLGREYLYAGQPDKAIEVTDRCMKTYPTTAHCYYARGAIHLQLEEYEQALPYLARALEMQPESGIVHHRLGLALENLDRLDEAKAHYRRAVALGYRGAEHQLARLEKPGTGLLPAKRTAVKR